MSALREGQIQFSSEDAPACTKEACQFNDNLHAFQAAKLPVIGISRDSAESHQRFRGKYGLRFPLLTDADHAVTDAYGAWGEKHRYGKVSIGVIRSTFLIDEQGRIERPGTTSRRTTTRPRCLPRRRPSLPAV